MRRIGLLAALICLLVMPILATVPAYADVNDFTITNFTSDQTLTREDSQGTLHIIEEISVVFTDNNHGIIRAIPNSYKGNSLNFHLNSVTSASGAPSQVDQSKQSGNVTLRIGDPNKTVTGAQQYKIDYTLDNVITFYEDHDELYWDVNGDEWDQPTTTVKVLLHLPGGLTLSSDNPKCFAGVFGAIESNCVVKTSEGTLEAEAVNLAPRETLTYVAGFAKGYFQPETTAEKLKDNLGLIVGLIVLPLSTAAVAFRWWWTKGRDMPGRGVIVPEYEAIEGLTPLEAGAIRDFAVDNRDITATLIDMARRGYITIIEQRKDRKILKDKITYSLKLSKADISGLNQYEQKLINALFKDIKLDETVALGSVQSKLYTAATSIRKSVSKDLAKSGYFREDPYKFTLKFGLFTVAFICVYFFAASLSTSLWPFVVGAIVSAIIVFLFARVMPARTEKGVAAKEHLEGLKLYMNTAEKDRIDKLEAPNASYAAGAGQPVRTVELFEKLLPFAIVMGVEKAWAQQFQSLYTSPPSWYSGNSSGFNSVYLANSLNGGFASVVNTSFSPPSNSGGSGFSGGGSSGGGGGGGGGGGW